MYWIEEEFMDRLNEFVLHKRFETIEELSELIDKQENWVDCTDVFSHKVFMLEDISQNDEENCLHDYNLAGEFDGKDIYCDLDIYYLIDRQGNYYITEIGYNFE